ncbi:MAG: hypothetical protein KAI70_00695 [Candidatus Omnitrophica bacterium]|nr:hypothetical protein [Candidatus Omnitrophota bacterium]
MGYILTEEMGQEISNKIMFHLVKSGIEADHIGFDKLVDRQVGALQRPVANIAIDSGSFKKITLTSYKQFITISIFMMIQDLRSEEARRFKAYKLLTQIAKVLMLEKLGLDLQDPIMPTTFENVTDEKYSSAGYSIYKLDLTCSFNIEKDFEKDLGTLHSIVNEYYLQEPSDDGIEDMEGLVVLQGICGGSADTVFKAAGVYGGRAGTTYTKPARYGGRAGSTY